MKSKLIDVRLPTSAERKTGAEVIFERELDGVELKIYGCKCYESWEQWGPVSTEILSDNVADIERWRRAYSKREAT